MAHDDGREGKTRHRQGAILSGTAYRVLLSTSYSLWGGILIVFTNVGKFSVSVKRDDFLPLISTTAALAAIAIAILTYLKETASRDRYLKLALAGLTTMFLLATITGFLSAFTFSTADQHFEKLHLRFIVLGFFYIGVAAIIPFGTVLTKLGPIILSATAVVERIQDYSFFLAAAATFVVWTSEFSLAAVTIVATLGGMVLLLSSSAVMLVSVAHAKTYQEELEERIVETLRGARQSQQPLGLIPHEVPLSQLRNQLHSNDETLLDAIENLKSEDRIVKVGYERSYYILEVEDEARVVDTILKHDVVVLSKKLDAEQWEPLLRALEEHTRLPRRVLHEYFGETIRKCVEQNFDGKGIGASWIGENYIELEAFIRRGVLEGRPDQIRSEVRRVMAEPPTYSGHRDFGTSILALLSCLPPVNYLEGACTNVANHIEDVVLKTHKGFLDEADWLDFNRFVDAADVLLIGDTLYDEASTQTRIPREVIETCFASRLLPRRGASFTVLVDPYQPERTIGRPWNVAIRTRSFESIYQQTKRTKEFLAQSGGETDLSEIEESFNGYRVVPSLPSKESAKFWKWFIDRVPND